jgi:hypothetical protein
VFTGFVGGKTQIQSPLGIVLSAWNLKVMFRSEKSKASSKGKRSSFQESHPMKPHQEYNKVKSTPKNNTKLNFKTLCHLATF